MEPLGREFWEKAWRDKGEEMPPHIVKIWDDYDDLLRRNRRWTIAVLYVAPALVALVFLATIVSAVLR